MGMLAGRYLPNEAAPAGSRLAEGRNFMTERVNQTGREVGAKMVELARERNLTASQLALLWCKDQPGITAPIIGPRTVAQLQDALPVLERTLPEEDRPIFDSLVHPGNAVADFHTSAWWMKGRIGNL
jgi:aryl-alcohol dehydrogenase-like predicted oxidoreductase